MRRQPTKPVFDWLVGFKHVCISIPRNRMVFTITPKDYYFVWRCLEFGDVWGELNHPQNHVVPFSWCSILMARCLSLQRRNQCLDCGRRGEMRFHYHRILTVLVYMVLHGSHQYTPVMLAYIPYMDAMGDGEFTSRGLLHILHPILGFSLRIRTCFLSQTKFK